MKKGKTKGKKFKPNYFKGFISSLSTIMAYVLLVIVVLYFLTDYAMTTENTQYIQYFHLTKDYAAYLHHQLTLPFCVCAILFITPNLNK